MGYSVNAIAMYVTLVTLENDDINVWADGALWWLRMVPGGEPASIQYNAYL